MKKKKTNKQTNGDKERKKKKTYRVALFMELRKNYYRGAIYKLMESLFSTFVIYSNLKLQIDNPLGYLKLWSSK